MGCNPPYITKLTQDREVQEDLTRKHHELFKRLIDSKLFRKYTTGDTIHYYLPKLGTEKYLKARQEIIKTNQDEGENVVGTAFTKQPPFKEFVFVNVRNLVDRYEGAREHVEQEHELGINPQGDSLLKVEGDSFSQTKLSKPSQKKVEEFLEKRGIRIADMTQEESKLLAKRLGLSENATIHAITTTLEGLIQITEGSRDISLGEEAGHITTSMLKYAEPKLYQEMFSKVGQMKVWDLVKNDTSYSNNPLYMKDGKPNIPLLKEEAIGKLIHEQLAALEGSENRVKEFQETPENQGKIQLWWNKVKDFFKRLFNKYGDNPFQYVAKEMLKGKDSTLEGSKDDLQGESKLLKVENNPDKKKEQEERYAKLVEMSSKVAKTPNGFEVDGRKVRFQVEEPKLDRYTKQIEEKGDLDVKDILSRYIADDGSLRSTPLDRPDNAVSNLNPKSEAGYGLIEQSLAKRLTEYPEGTKFAHNISIFQPSIDKAGKVDFLAMMPNGKSDLLSFDFLTSGDTEDKDIKLRTQRGLQKALNVTAGILKIQYGIKDFDKIRSIPIYTTYVSETSTAINVSMDGLKTSDKIAEFRPVPALQERTGDQKIDRLLDKLVAIYSNKERAKKTDEKARTMRLMSQSIREAQLDNGIPALTKQISNAALLAEGATRRFVEEVSRRSADKMTSKYLAKYSDDLNRSYDDLTFYKDAYSYYKNFYGDEPTEEEENLFEQLRNASDRAGNSLRELTDAMHSFVDQKLATKYGIKDILLPEARISLTAAYMNTFSEATTKAQTLFFKIYRDASNRYENKVLETLQRTEELKKGIEGKDIKEINRLLKKKDTNELIDQYDPKFRKDLKDNISLDEEPTKADKDKALAWAKDNIDVPAFEEWLKAEKKKEVARVISTLDGKHLENTLGYITKKFNLNNALLSYRMVKNFPHEKWYSPEYKELTKKGNEPIKAIYDFAREVNQVAAESGYIEHVQKKNFLPFVDNTVAKAIVLGGKYSIRNAFLDSITVTDANFEGATRNRLTGEIVYKVPKYFTNDRDDKDPSYLSQDILTNLTLYASKVAEFQERSKIESQAILVMRLEKDKQSLQTNQYGHVDPNADPVEENQANYQALRNHVLHSLYGQRYAEGARMDSISDTITDKLNKMVDGINKTTGMHIEGFEGDRRISATKVLDSMKLYQQMKVLSVNLGTSLFRLLNTNLQGLVRQEEYYGRKEFFQAELQHAGLQMFKQDASIHVLAMKTFLPVDSQLHTTINKLSLSKLTRESTGDMLMGLIKHAHDWIQYVNFSAMMQNAVLIDGKIHNARKYIRASKEYAGRYEQSFEERKAQESQFDEKVKALIAEHGLVGKMSEKDGKLVVDGLNLNSSTVADFKSLVRYEGLRLSGNISHEDESIFRMTVLGRQLSMFKNWIPGSIKTQFRGLKYIVGKDEYEWGRLNTLGKIITQNGFSAISRYVSMVRATEKGVEYMDSLLEAKKAAHLLTTGKELDITKEQFYDLVRKNLKQTGREVACMLALLGATMAIMSAYKNSKDKERGFWAWTHRVADRSYEEFNLYYNPISLSNIVNGSLFPTMGLPVDIAKFLGAVGKDAFGHITGDEDEIKRAHPAKYLLKNFPVAKEVPNYISVFAPEWAKELGINTQPTIQHN